MQGITQDHILRGVISETRPAIFWVGADGVSMLDSVSSCSTDGGARSINDTEGTLAQLRSMDDSYCIGRPSKRNHPDVIVVHGKPPRDDGNSKNYGGGGGV